MKKRVQKLRLNRETLLNLSENEANKAAGGGWRCGSLDCSNNCPNTGGDSDCICPFTMSVPPAFC